MTYGVLILRGHEMMNFLSSFCPYTHTCVLQQIPAREVKSLLANRDPISLNNTIDEVFLNIHSQPYI